MDDSVSHTWVEDSTELRRLCDHWLSLPAIGIDTEFVRTRTFFARLGLVQVHADGENWLIDPLAAKELEPLYRVLSSASVTKIIHSGSEDIEIFHRLGEAPLRGFFDTQVAAALCGIGPSLSYQALVQELLGIEVDKGQTRSDWLQRPLSASQKRYATLDVAWLPQIHALLARRLSELGRLEWLEEDCDVLVARKDFDDQILELYRKFKLAWRMDGPKRAVLWALLEWRERTARDRDRPRRHVLTDADLLAMVQALPESPEEFADLELEQPRSVRRYSQALVGVIAQARASDQAPEAPPEPLDREMRSTVKAVRGEIAETAEQLGLAPEFLCGRREVLHVLQHGRPSPRLDGWRLALLEPLFEPWLEPVS